MNLEFGITEKQVEIILVEDDSTFVDSFNEVLESLKREYPSLKAKLVNTIDLNRFETLISNADIDKICILDIRLKLPRIDGRTFLKKVKTVDKTIPTIVYTFNKDYQIDCEKIGLSSELFIVKDPVDEKIQIETILKNLLGYTASLPPAPTTINLTFQLSRAPEEVFRKFSYYERLYLYKLILLRRSSGRQLLHTNTFAFPATWGEAKNLNLLQGENIKDYTRILDLILDDNYTLVGLYLNNLKIERPFFADSKESIITSYSHVDFYKNELGSFYCEILEIFLAMKLAELYEINLTTDDTIEIMQNRDDRYKRLFLVTYFEKNYFKVNHPDSDLFEKMQIFYENGFDKLLEIFSFEVISTDIENNVAIINSKSINQNMGRPLLKSFKELDVLRKTGMFDKQFTFLDGVAFRFIKYIPSNDHLSSFICDLEPISIEEYNKYFSNE